MRIYRDNSHSYRRSSRFGGCLPVLTVIVLLLGTGFLARDWLRQWALRWLQTTPQNVTLRDTQLAFASGDLDRTIEYARQLLEIEPHNHEALVMLARALVYRSYSDITYEIDRSRALQLTRQAFEQFPLDNTVTGIHTFVLQANGESDEAGRLALRAILRDENSITARLALSLSYGSRSIFEAALREAEQAVQIANNFAPDWRADAYRVLAIAYSDLGRYSDAAAAVEQAIQYNRRLVPLHFERALYAMQVGDGNTATAYYFNVIAFDEDNVKARFRLCELSSTLREGDAAIEYCTFVTEHAPGWSDGWYRLGREHFLQGHFAEARDALGRCSTLQVAQGMPIAERRFECWYIQGQAAEVLGDCDTLVPLYAEFQEMVAEANIAQTWTYPPEGPSICAEPRTEPEG
jgi:tetratricopeptide (TPR) repeat protein